MDTIDEFEILGIQDKFKFPTTGVLSVLAFDEKEGLYLKGASIDLPIEFKEVFYQLRKTGGHNLWQLRSPINFRIDLAHKDKPKQPHFFTLADLEATNETADTLTVSGPHFQEVTDQLELIRLVEIQDTFVKLLRRL